MIDFLFCLIEQYKNPSNGLREITLTDVSHTNSENKLVVSSPLFLLASSDNHSKDPFTFT